MCDLHIRVADVIAAGHGDEHKQRKRDATWEVQRKKTRKK